MRARLKVPAGGYILAPDGRKRVIAELRNTKDRKVQSPSYTDFYIDDQHVKRDKRVPINLAVSSEDVAAGYHTVRAVVVPKRGKIRSVVLPIAVSSCPRDFFSPGLSSKMRRAHPNAILRIRTAGQPIGAVRFRLPSHLQWLGRNALAHKKIGRLKLTNSEGKVQISALRLPRALFGTLLRSANALVSLSRGHTKTISVASIGENVTAVEVDIYGKRLRLLKNPSSCLSRHLFRADLGLQNGGSTQFTRGLIMCKSERDKARR